MSIGYSIVLYYCYKVAVNQEMSEIRLLNQYIKSLQAENSAKNTQRETLYSRLQLLTVQNKQLQCQIQQLQASNLHPQLQPLSHQLQYHLQYLQNQLNSHGKLLQQKDMQLSSTLHQRNILEQRTIVLQAKIYEYKNSHIRMSQNILDMEERIQAFMEEYQQMKEEIQQANQYREHSKAQLTVVKEELQAVKGELGTVKGELEEVKQDRDIIKGEVDVVLEKYQILVKENSEIQKELEELSDDRDRIKGQLDLVKEQNYETNEQMEAVRKELEIVKEEKQKIQKQRDQAKEQIEEMVNKYKIEMEKEKEENQKMKGQISKLKKQITRIKSQRKSLHQQLETLQIQYTKICAKLQSQAHSSHSRSHSHHSHNNSHSQNSSQSQSRTESETEQRITKLIQNYEKIQELAKQKHNENAVLKNKIQSMKLEFEMTMREMNANLRKYEEEISVLRKSRNIIKDQSRSSSVHHHQPLHHQPLHHQPLHPPNINLIRQNNRLIQRITQLQKQKNMLYNDVLSLQNSYKREHCQYLENQNYVIKEGISPVRIKTARSCVSDGNEIKSKIEELKLANEMLLDGLRI